MTTPHNDQGAPVLSDLESVYMQMIHLLPRNALSRGVGSLSDMPIPVALRGAVYGEFARRVGANIDEAEKPLEAYPSLNAFFTRRLKEGLRPVDSAPGALVSPVDGKISEFGAIEDGMLVQTKGRLYSLRDLVVTEKDQKAFEGGSFMTIYLSPKDYHRVHFPVQGSVHSFAYHPGHLFPVNAPSVKSVDNLFAVNERVCVYMDAFEDAGESIPVAVILVGATCVGRMTLAFDDLVTNVSESRAQRVQYADKREFEAGDELGAFNLGSTVIMLIGKSSFEFSELAQKDRVVRLGERLGKL